MWPDAGGVEVGVASCRIDGVLLKVLTEVFCCGLRQQPVDAFPVTENAMNITNNSKMEDVCREEIL